MSWPRTVCRERAVTTQTAIFLLRCFYLRWRQNLILKHLETNRCASDTVININWWHDAVQETVISRNIRLNVFNATVWVFLFHFNRFVSPVSIPSIFDSFNTSSKTDCAKCTYHARSLPRLILFLLSDSQALISSRSLFGVDQNWWQVDHSMSDSHIKVKFISFAVYWKRKWSYDDEALSLSFDRQSHLN